MSLVRVARFAEESQVDGPGNRTVVWFQGCSVHCPGCQNKILWPANTGHAMSPVSLAQHLAQMNRVGPNSHEYTFTGGEPLDQGVALFETIRFLRLFDPDAHVIVYTGWTWEWLHSNGDTWQKLAIAATDILVDGPYIISRDNDYMQWRGSDNQRPIMVDETYNTGHVVVADWDQPTVIIANGELVMTGGLAIDLGLAGNDTNRCGQAEERTE